MNELDLDRAFAEKVSNSRKFQEWLLGRTRFSAIAKKLTLLNKEQAEAKPQKKPENWWRHWWCRLDDGTESETDIFLVFESKGTGERVALHIEDKPPHGEFTPNQCENYDRRDRFMSNKRQFMNYGEFETILLAPKALATRNSGQIEHFGVFLSYEEVAEHIGLFSAALQEA